MIVRVLPIMPSRKLVEHEWEKHGVCSGLNAEGYFGYVEQLLAGITVPERFNAPQQAFRVSPKEIRRAFLDSNPSLTAQAIVVPCKTKLLDEVRICYDRSASPRACAADVAKAACTRGQLIVQPER